MERGVRQGDNMFPKLFTILLEYMFKEIQWDKMSNKHGEKLNQLRFADNVLISDSMNEVNEMLNQLNAALRKVGLKMNLEKTQFMTNLVPSQPAMVEDVYIKQVHTYKCLGHEICI